MRKILILVSLLISFFTLVQAGWLQQYLGPVRLNDIDFPPNNTTTGFACGLQGLLVKTTNGGDTWVDEILNDVDTLYAINFPVNEIIGYIAGDRGRVVKTTNSGENWEVLNIGNPTDLFGICFPMNNDTGFVIGPNSLIMKTYDGGITWEDISFADPMKLNEVFFLNTRLGWIVGEYGAILRTTDGFAWTPLNSGVITELFGVYFCDSNLGWVVGADKICLRTTDGGENWEAINIPLPTNTILYSVIFPIDNNTGYVCGSSGNIAKTVDGGENWTTYNLGYDFYDIEFPLDNLVGWVCGQNAAIYKTTDGGWIEEIVSNDKNVEHTLHCTPNPFCQTTVIQVPSSINRKNQLTVNIYDITGKLIKSLFANPQTPTTSHHLVWDGRNNSNLPVKSGVYFLKAIIDNNITQPIKLVLLD
jgi:photosystem II stability/assembly factor-like uncharacterized protein